MLKRKTMVLSNDNNFCASSRWFYRFLNRHSLSLRLITTSGRDSPRNAPQIINEFLDECHKDLAHMMI